MKPHLLMLLLLAIPPLIANVLACENAETTEAPAVAKPDAVAKDTPPAPATSRTPAPAASTTPAPAPAKPARGASNGGLKAWFIM